MSNFPHMIVGDEDQDVRGDGEVWDWGDGEVGGEGMVQNNGSAGMHMLQNPQDGWSAG